MSTTGSTTTRYAVFVLVMVAVFVLIAAVTTVAAGSSSRTYTLDADFDEGTLVNLNHDAPNSDQLQLDSQQTPFEFIWVAASGRGTIIKIDTLSGAILGEYQSAPDGRGRNPSRTTVDGNGNVWAGNRDEADGGNGSMVEVGLQENGQCVDRNGNGVIETSTGLGLIKPWLNPSDVDDNGGVSSAQDECIIKYVRVSGDYVRHVSVDRNNNVWAAGNFGADNSFDLIDGTSGAILASTGNLDCGGYGGLVDKNDVLWSSNRAPGATSLLRYDTKGTVPVADDTYSCLYSPNTYGLGIDSSGNIWNPQWTSNNIRKFNPSGVLFAGFPVPSGGSNSRGAVITAVDDHVWVANSGSDTVSHLDNNGVLVGTIAVGSMPTGVAVDDAGKVWVTNHNSHDVMRIDPALNSSIGAVDLTVSLGDGAYPYNYSDMTGSTLIAPPNSGTWTVIFDSGLVDAPWHEVSWTSFEPGDSTIVVKVASGHDGVTFGPEETMTNGGDPTVSDGQYLEISVTFTRGSAVAPAVGPSPVLEDLTVVSNRPPVADPNGPYTGDEGSAISIDGTGSSDPDDDVLTYAWSYTAGIGVDAGATCSFADATAALTTITCTDDGIYDLTLTVDDGFVSNSDSTTVTVANVAPTVTIDNVAPTLIAVGESVTAVGSFTDPGTNDTHTAVWDWGDTGTSAGTVIGLGVGPDNHTYTAPNIYTIRLTVTDDDGGVGWDEFEFVVVYDPDDGFVTGGGWIDSPAGAYTPDPLLTGRATFGFVSKYKKGAEVPTGNTEFQFHAGDLNFHSSSYDWLVVTGSDFAMFKGEGTINGGLAPSGNLYKFRIWAGDDDPDTFRIKIWDEDSLGAETDLYDNGTDQALGSGSIIIHTKTKK